jgi:hypothetical protein
VGKTRWACHGRRHADLRRLRIAHLADHDDIGILAEDGAERRGEGDARLPMHRHLRDAAQLVLDRGFDCDDLLACAIALGEAGIERRRLATAGGAGDEEHAVRPRR